MKRLYVFLTGRRVIRRPGRVGGRPRAADPRSRRRRSGRRRPSRWRCAAPTDGAARWARKRDRLPSRESSADLGVLELQVRLQSVAAALPAEAGLLVAPERRRRIGAVEGVRPHDAGTQTLRHPEDARALLGPDACAEAVRRVVRLLDGLVGRAEGEHRQHRAEDLLLCYAIALRDVREDGRCEPVALLRQPARRLVDLRALLLAGFDELTNLVELLLGVDRPDVGVLVQRIADAKRRQPALELLHDGLVDRLLDEQARAGAADVPLVEVDAVDDPLDGLIESGVVEDDVRGLAAELERELLSRSRELALDRLADLGGAGEGDLVDAVRFHERGAGVSVAGDDVHD